MQTNIQFGQHVHLRCFLQEHQMIPFLAPILHFTAERRQIVGTLVITLTLTLANTLVILPLIPTPMSTNYQPANGSCSSRPYQHPPSCRDSAKLGPKRGLLEFLVGG